MNKLITPCLIFLSGCNLSSNNAAVAFLWNEEPTETSSRIMVITESPEDELREKTIKNLDDLGFIVESLNEEEIVTEPIAMEDNLMRISVEFNNNVIIISGEQGVANHTDDIDWEPVSRGEDTDPYASPEWELMNVLASAIDNTSIRYN